MTPKTLSHNAKEYLITALKADPSTKTVWEQIPFSPYQSYPGKVFTHYSGSWWVAIMNPKEVKEVLALI